MFKLGCLILYFGCSWLCQRVRSFSMFSNVSWLCWLVFSNCFQCFGFLLVSSSLSAVVLSCGVCLEWFYVVLGCFAMFLVSCFNWCFVVSSCSNCLMFEIALVRSKLFYVVFFEWF